MRRYHPSIMMKSIPRRVTGVVLISAAVLSLFNVSCQRERTGHFTVLPLLSDNKDLACSVAWAAGLSLRSAPPKQIIIRPLLSQTGMVVEDSLSTAAGARRYAERSGVDQLLLIHVRQTLSDKAVLDWSLVRVKGEETILNANDTLVYRDAEACFHRLADRLSAEQVPVSAAADSLIPVIPEGDDWHRLGRGLHRELFGDVTAAERAYREELASSPECRPASLGLARVLVRLGLRSKGTGRLPDELYQEAEESLRKLRRDGAFRAEALRLLGRLYIQKGRFNEGERFVKQAYSIRPDDPRVLLELSRLHPSRFRDLGFRSRLAILNRCLKLNPAFLEASLSAADIYYFRNQTKKAEDVYEKILRINPVSLDALMALGKIYVLKGDVSRIITTYQRVLEIDPQYPEAYYNLGIAYFNSDRREEAARFFHRAIELDDHADSYFYLGVIEMEAGHKEQAIHYFRERIKRRQGMDDTYANEAVDNLYQLLHGDEQ